MNAWLYRQLTKFRTNFCNLKLLIDPVFEKEYLRSAEDILKKRFEQKKSIELSAAQAAIEFAISFPVSLGLYQLYGLPTISLSVCLFVRMISR